jgi:hypothetical protein
MPISIENAQLRRRQRPDSSCPTKRTQSERAPPATDGRVRLGDPDDPRRCTGFAGKGATYGGGNARAFVPAEGDIAVASLAVEGGLDELEPTGQTPRRTFQEPERLRGRGPRNKIAAVFLEVIEPIGQAIRYEAGRVTALPSGRVNRVRVFDMNSHAGATRGSRGCADDPRSRRDRRPRSPVPGRHGPCPSPRTRASGRPGASDR